MTEGTQFLPTVMTPAVGVSPALETLRSRWKQGELPDIWEIIAKGAVLPPEHLVTLLQETQWVHWQRHQPVLVESFFERCPQLLQQEAAALTLIASEVRLRQSLHQTPSLTEYAKRFPQWSSQLATYFSPPSDATILTSPGEQATTAKPVLNDQTIFPNKSTETLFNAPPPAVNDQTLFPADGVPLAAPPVLSVPQIPGYEVVSELGRGGMGVVYKAHQTRAGRDVALKVIRPDMLGIMPSDTQSNTIGRFRHEARAAGKLQHDHIVTVFEVGEWNAFHYFAMRLVDGPSLVQLVRERPLENRKAAAFLAGTARGVQFAHDQGILHRDLKPHNVLIDNHTQRALVADFGLAKFTADTEELTRAGDVIGTPSYMSPEQARDSSKVTHLSDVYSLGATLYHVIAGKPPFQAANLGETIRQILHDEPLSPRQLNPAVDADLETICLKSLQKEPVRRYQSAGELADDLDRYLRGEPIQARPISTSEKLIRWCKRNPALSGSLGAALALAFIAVMAIILGYRNTAAALAQSQVNLHKSEASLKQALSAVHDLLTRVSEDDLRDQPGLQQVRRDLLVRAKDRLQGILQQNMNNPRIREDVAKAYFNVGAINIELNDPTEATKYLQGAERLQRLMLEENREDKNIRLELSDTLNSYGLLYAKVLNDFGQAKKVFSEAIALRDGLAHDFPSDEEQIRKQANTHMNYGNVLNLSKQREEGQAELEKAQQIREALLAKHPGNTKVEQDLALGSFQLAMVHFNLFESTKEERLGEAVDRDLKRAIEIYERLVEKEPHRLLTRSRLVECYRWLAVRLEQQAMFAAEAAAMYEKAIVVAEKLDRENPHVADYRLLHAQVVLQYSYLLQSNPEHLDLACEKLKLIVERLKPLAETNSNACQIIAIAHYEWAHLLHGDVLTEEARQHYQQSLDYRKLWEKQTGGDPDSHNAIAELTQILQPATSEPPKSSEN